MSRRSMLGGVLAASLLVLAAPTGASAASLPAGTTAVLSGTPDLLGLLATPVSASLSTGGAVDDHGGEIVFESGSDGLAIDDDDDVTNVYVKHGTGEVELVSRASDGGPSHTDCFDAVISGNGNRVAFVCSGALVPADRNGEQDVYLRDLVAGTTTLVSSAPDGSVGDSLSFDPAIDEAGDFVAFTSGATNLVALAPGTPPALRILRREIGNRDRMVLVSVRSNGDPNLRVARSASISNSGAVVAFDTDEALSSLDDNNVSDVYVRGPIGGLTVTMPVSVADRDALAPGVVGNRPSFFGLISGDGRRVAFTSEATNLEAAPVHDTGGGLDVYVRDLGGTTKLVSVTPGGVSGNAASEGTGIDDGGTTIGFVSTATNLDPADAKPGLDGYVSRDGQVSVVSRPTGTAAPAADNALDVAISGDGRKAVMTVLTPVVDDVERFARVVVRRDLDTDTTQAVSRPLGSAPFVNDGGFASAPSVSADGRYVAFVTTASGLGAVDGSESVVVRDVVTGAVTVVSREDGESGALLDGSDPRISADGRRVAFVAFVNGTSQVLVRDIERRRTFVASSADGSGGVPGDKSSRRPSISDDGSRVAFLSEATNLRDDDADNSLDAHVRLIDAGRTLLIDRADGAAGDLANAGASDVVLSGDGRHAAFETSAKNLGDGDKDAFADVHVRDIDAGRTRLVSVNDQQVKGDKASGSPTISRDGDRVGFTSQATNFGGTGPQVYVRDTRAGTLRLAGRANGLDGAPLGEEVFDFVLSADGEQLAFVAVSTPGIAPDAPADNAPRVYERDLGSGATRLISRRTGVAGAPTDTSTGIRGDISVSADGGCVAFSAFGRLLPEPANAEYNIVYMRAVTADCGRHPAAGPGPGPVAKPAVLSRLAVRPARFHVGGRRGGTRISFRLDKSSGVALTFDRLLAGHRKKGKRCSTRVRRGRRCTVAKRAGRLVLAQGRLHAGANTVKFSGKVGRKALAPGRYRLTATPAGGKGRSVTFAVVKASRASHRPAKRTKPGVRR
jgi:Tol biopolymer transport system component